MNSNMNMNMLMMALGREMPTSVSDCLVTYICRKMYANQTEEAFDTKFINVFGGYAILDYHLEAEDYDLESICSNASCSMMRQ